MRRDINASVDSFGLGYGETYDVASREALLLDKMAHGGASQIYGAGGDGLTNAHTGFYEPTSFFPEAEATLRGADAFINSPERLSFLNTDSDFGYGRPRVVSSNNFDMWNDGTPIDAPRGVLASISYGLQSELISLKNEGFLGYAQTKYEGLKKLSTLATMTTLDYFFGGGSIVDGFVDKTQTSLANDWQKNNYFSIGVTSSPAVELLTGGLFTKFLKADNLVDGISNNTYTGDIYGSDFVGAVDWQNFYRGDITQRSTFTSSLAQERGVDVSNTSYLDAQSNGLLDELFDKHGNVGSQGLPTIGVSKDPAVAEYFARGSSRDQNGFVTEFRMERREFESMTQRNFENRRDVFDINPNIGKQEQEFLFNTEINSKYILQQWQVK